MNELCKTCSRQNLCGNNFTKGFCTGYQANVSVKWTHKVEPLSTRNKKENIITIKELKQI